MIPNYRKPRKKGQFVIPGQTKITAFVTCSYQPHTTHTPRFPPPTKHAPSRQTQLSPSCQTQSSISPFVTTIHKASDPMTPKKLRHSSPVLSMSPLNLHLLLSPSTASSPLPLLSSSSPSLSPQIKTKLTQTTLTKYFLIKPKQQQQTGPLLQPSSPKPIGPTKHHRKIQYKYHLPRNQPLISNFTVAYPKPDLQDTWGHSFMEIDPLHTFRIFLQNPNGININPTNFTLLKDFQTCHNYGAAIISLPETKTNWRFSHQKTMLHGLLRRVWNSSAFQTSHSSELFLSDRKPGGTATIVCANWTSRLVHKGEDPLGLGRWSYVTLRGKGTKLLTIVTAYNQPYSLGDTTGNQ